MDVNDIDNLPSRPFKGFDWSEHPNVERLLDYLYDEYAGWYKERGGKVLREPRKVRNHIMHFVLELYRAHKALPGLLVGIPLHKPFYDEKDRYHPAHLAYRVTINALNFLIDKSYIKRPLGISNTETIPKNRRRTRHQATEKLINLFNEYGVNRYMIAVNPHKPPEIIIQREPKERGESTGGLVDYEENQFTRQARKNLQSFNEFLGHHHIDIKLTVQMEEQLTSRMLRNSDPSKEKWLDFTRTSLHRVFNNSSFEDGGRFYGGWWQNIPSDYRKYITIDNEHVVGMDYSGMVFAIMYAGAGATPRQPDPYRFPGYDKSLRKHLKKAANIAINCKDERGAVMAINERIDNGELSGELGDGKRVLQAFQEAHPALKDKIASGEGVKAQFTESLIAERIMLSCITKQMPVLPIHDGFLAKASDMFELKNLMETSFAEQLGSKAIMKFETLDYRVIEYPDSNSILAIKQGKDGAIRATVETEDAGHPFSDVPPQDLWEIVSNPHKDDKPTRRWEEWKKAHKQMDT
jgi:hypothetical protein